MERSNVEKRITRRRPRRSKTLEKKFQVRKCQSTDNLEELKVLNTSSKYELFINVSEAFENILNTLEIENNHEKSEVYKKLIKIQYLIETKISSLESTTELKKNSLKNAFSVGDLTKSASETLSLCSETSSAQSYLDDSVHNFMTNVNCPFCSECQTDKLNLVKHINEKCTASLLNNCEKEYIPFSAFQILPNNTFRCNICPNSVLKNINQYFKHSKNPSHIFVLSALSEKKHFSNFLFCSCCKMLVPDNHTQIYFHINHEAHTRCKSTTKMEDLLKKKIYCVFNKKKKFKCLACHPSQSTFETFPKMLDHFKVTKHTHNITEGIRQTSLLFCEICSKEVHFLNLRKHLISSNHLNCERNCEEERYELCLFCGLKCSSLTDLSEHMKLLCTEINKIKEELLKLENFDKQNLTEEESKKKTAKNDNKGHCIIVRGHSNLTELFEYFKKFGEIGAVKIYQKKDVLIKFLQKNSLENVLTLHNTHIINGVKLEISTVESYCKRGEEMETLVKTDEEGKGSDICDTDLEKAENYVDKNEGLDLGAGSQNKEELVELFERVAAHLMVSSQSLDCGTMLKIAVAETIRTGHCSFVGFPACQLSFPSDSVNFHIQVDEIWDFLNSYNDLAIDDECVLMNTKELRKSYEKMRSSVVWENVTLVTSESYIPYIKCTHAETRKPCTITFMQSTKILSSMLSDCVKENNVVRPFCLLIRFWMSVRKLKIKEFDYAVISLLVYFLKSRNVVKTSFDSYKKGIRAALLEMAVSGESSFNQSSFSIVSSKSSNIRELFQEFLEFLYTFNFERNAICLPFDHPVPRTILTKNKSSEIFSKLSDPNKLNMSPMCILDPLLLVNLASGIDKSDMKLFLEVLSDSVQSKSFNLTFG